MVCFFCVGVSLKSNIKMSYVIVFFINKTMAITNMLSVSALYLM